MCVCVCVCVNEYDGDRYIITSLRKSRVLVKRVLMIGNVARCGVRAVTCFSMDVEVP